MQTGTTIFAASSGLPPAAISIVRISGPQAGGALAALRARIPPPRQARLRTLYAPSGAVLDRAMVLWFPAPASATGDDIVELHCHGGRAVIAAVEAALTELPGLRRAEPGEFTRRAFANGLLDLAEVEGLADLLAAETELERRNAVMLAGGELSRTVDGWRDRLLAASAIIEALLDFADEDEVAGNMAEVHAIVAELAAGIGEWLVRPRAETLREGVRVVLAGEPNAGKSTLFNALVETDAAIVAPTAGTTRDVLVRTVAIEGVPLTLVDTAGLHSGARDAIEIIGIDRAWSEIERADVILWLGEFGKAPAGAWEIEAQIDRLSRPCKPAARHRVSALTGIGLDALRRDLVASARKLLPKPGITAINQRQRDHLTKVAAALAPSIDLHDALLVAEHLRLARMAFDALTGRLATEDMLDALFGRFCLGK